MYLLSKYIISDTNEYYEKINCKGIENGKCAISDSMVRDRLSEKMMYEQRIE